MRIAISRLAFAHVTLILSPYKFIPTKLGLMLGLFLAPALSNTSIAWKGLGEAMR